MTREEAIEALTSKDVCNPDLILEALDMAIEALKQESKTDAFDKIKWLIEQYESEIEKCAEDRRNMPMSPTQAYLTAKIGVYGKVIADLKELIESEDRHE